MNSDESAHPDPDILRRFIAGEEDAFLALHTMYARLVLSFLVSRSPSKSVAEDLSQEVWLRIHKSRKQFDGKNFRAWMFTIANNLLRDAGRTASRRGTNPGLEAIPEPSQTFPDENGLERHEELQTLRDTINGCLETIDPKNARIFRLAAEHKPADVARELGVDPEYVHKKKFVVKSLLLECLKKKLPTESMAKYLR